MHYSPYRYPNQLWKEEEEEEETGEDMCDVWHVQRGEEFRALAPCS